MILLDANVLVYGLDEDAVQYEHSREVLAAAAAGKLPCVLVPQVLLEFYTVVTSARRVRSPLPSGRARAVVRDLASAVEVKPVPAHVMGEFDGLLDAHPRTAAAAFDLFLVAQMRCHGIGDICTYNVSDFDLPGVRALTPPRVLAAYAG